MPPALRCFVHFDAQMCLAPQPRAIFQHLNFKNGSGNVVFCTFWLSNVLFATAACHFSPVRRTATSAPAALASLLFEHQEPRFIEKTQRFATSLTFFAHVELLACDSTRMLIFLLVTWLMLIFLLVTWLLCDSAFQLYILSEVRLLNFLRLLNMYWMIFRCILKCVFYHDLWQNVVSKSWICPLCFPSGNPQPRRRPIDFEAEVAGKHIPAEVSENSWTQKCPDGICDRFPGGFWLHLSWPECPYRLIRSQKWVLLALLWWLLPSGGGWSWALVCDFAAACIDDVSDIVWYSCNLVLVNDRRLKARVFFFEMTSHR